MTDREALKRKISMAQFAAFELHLFLNTHPDNQEALEKFRKYSEKTETLTKEFEANYGPLSSSSAEGNRWEWINDPWPWEEEANC